jgi:hypothetical protein
VATIDEEARQRSCWQDFCRLWWEEAAAPLVPEFRLLRELWHVADDGERAVLARALQRAFAREAG